MKLLLHLVAVTIAVLSGLSAAQAAEVITLKQQWQVGKRYLLSTEMDSESSMPVGNKKMEQKITVSTDVSAAVTKHEDGKSKRINLKYERLVMNIDWNGQKPAIDSTAPANEGDLAANLMLAVIGVELRLIVNEQDKVTSIENLNDVIKAAGGEKNPIASSLLTPGALNRTMQQSVLQTLPEHPVKPGDSWPYSGELPLLWVGKGSGKGTYTYIGQSRHDGVAWAEIAMTGKIEVDLKAPAAGGAAADPTGQLGLRIENGTTEGTIWFDNALGIARSTEIHQEMTLSMNNPAKADETVIMPIKQTVRTTLKSVEDLK